MATVVGSILAKLNLDIQDFSAKITKASNQMSGLATKMNKAYGNVQAGKKVAADTEEITSSYRDAVKALNLHNITLKDTARIVQGIVVAQTFYGAVNAIQDATAALWDFNAELDYARVTYTALFGDARLADNFMSALQEHSIETIFDYQDLAGLSKRLLAYGIEYKNLMFVMEGLTNLGAMSGDSAALDRIALALGQIYTRGKLSAEEMRQLANAYVPIYDIVQKEFNLTGEQMGRVGDLNLPAEDVINAVIDYANEHFGDVGDAAMMTITGLQNKIVDTLKVVGVEMIAPLSAAYKSFLAYVAVSLEDLRSAFASDGLGGVFEYLVPDKDTQATIRQFLANVRNLLMSLASVGAVVGQVFGNFIQVFMTMFNILAPVITGITNVLAAVVNGMLANERAAALLRIALVGAAGAFIVLRVQALASLVITAVTKAVLALSKALMVLSALIKSNPILMLLAGLAVTLAGISVASDSANSSIAGLFNTISGAVGGSSSGDILQKTKQEIEDNADAYDEFNERFEEGSENADEFADSIDGVGDSASKAAKKTNGLLSFDEVFKLNTPTSASGAGSGAGIGGNVLEDIENLMGGLGDLGGALIPDIPDFSEYINDFTDSLFGGIEDSLMDKLKSTAIGTLIGAGLGALIGGILGGPAGAALGLKIGALAGGIAGLLFDKLEGAMSNTPAGFIAGAATAIASAFAKAFGVPLATSLSGALAGSGLKAAFSVIGTSLKTAGLKSILKGGVIGAAIGLVVDGIAHMLWNTLEGKFQHANAESAKVGQTIGSVLGAVIGGILGGPAGIIIGSAIGTFAGGFVGLFWEPIAEYFDPENNVLSRFFVDTAKQLASWVSETATGFSTWFTETSAGFSEWWENTSSSFSTWWSDTTTGFSDWFNETVAIFTDWDSINGETLSAWWNETKQGFTDWNTETKQGLSDWRDETGEKFIEWWNETKQGFTDWRTETKESITLWASDALGGIMQWAEDSMQSITDFVVDAIDEFDSFAGKCVEAIVGFGIAGLKSLEDALAELGDSMNAWLEETAASVAEGWNNMFDTEKWASGWSHVKGWFSDLFTDISDWFKNIGRSISGWWDSLWDDKSVTVNTSANTKSGVGSVKIGHEYGGIFNREHVARFAEGNKAEMVVPLENASAMQPFVDAISNGIVSSLAPIVAQVNSNNSSNLPPMYVGTLVADERGLRQLYRKFEVINLQENARRGTEGGIF